MANKLKGINLLELYTESVIVIILILAYLNTGSYIHAAWNPAFLPKYVYYAMLFLGLPALLLNQQKFTKAIFAPFILWGMVYFLVILIQWTVAESKSADVAVTRMQYIILAIYFAVLLRLAKSSRWQKVFPTIALIVAGATLLDFFYPEILWPPGTENRIAGRANGFQPNSNAAAEVILLTVLLALPEIAVMQLRIWLMGVSALAVLVTFSRSGMLGWCILVMLGSLTRTLGKSALLLPVGAVLLLLSASVLLENYLIPALGYQSGSANLLARVDSIINFEFSDASTNERKFILQQGLEVFFSNPFTGAGPGAMEIRFGIGPHNQLLLMGAEYGIIGISLWIGLIVLIFRGCYFEQKSLQYISGILIGTYTFFSHNFLDYPFWLITYALLTDRQPYWKRSKPVLALPK